MDATFPTNPELNGMRSGYVTDTMLRLDLDSSGSLNSSTNASKGVKRKWSLRDGSMDVEGESPLCLWLGGSSSSSDSNSSSANLCTIMSKETDEESSMDIELDFSLHLGGQVAPNDICVRLFSTERCSWRHTGCVNGKGDDVCDLFARGKNGLCSSHGALVQDHRVHGGATLGTLANDTITTEDMDVDTDVLASSRLTGFGWNPFDVHQGSLSAEPGSSSGSEGRVHGGSLLALLTGQVLPTTHQIREKLAL